jgi:hypothetical protein
MTVITTSYSSKTKQELIDEILRLKKELKARNEEFIMLKKRLSLYKSLDDK